MTPFWNKAVTVLPLWMAPNTVTLTGLVMNFITFLLFAAYTPTLSEQAPRWVRGTSGTAPGPPQGLARPPVAIQTLTALPSPLRQVYVYSAFAMFAYQTMDAIDGKQARRTGAQSPLGQMFDHGALSPSPHAPCSAGAASGAANRLTSDPLLPQAATP